MSARPTVPTDARIGDSDVTTDGVKWAVTPIRPSRGKPNPAGPRYTGLIDPTAPAPSPRRRRGTSRTRPER